MVVLLVVITIGYTNDLQQLAVDTEIELMEGEEKSQEKDSSQEDNKVVRLAYSINGICSKVDNSNDAYSGDICCTESFRSDIPTPPPESMS